MNNLEARRRAMLAQAMAGGNAKITSYTCTSASFNENVNRAHIPLLANDEILIWNIRGNVMQSVGSVGGKMGIIVTQNGQVVSGSSGYKRMENIAAPDTAAPAAGWSDGSMMWIINGYYDAGTGTTFCVGVGNVIDFIQIPYNIGWNELGGNE